MADLFGMLQAAAGQVAAPTGYQIERSLRFNSADSAYLNRTPASAGNRKTWTWSGWVKRSALGVNQHIFESFPSSSPLQLTFFRWDLDNKFHVGSYDTSAYQWQLVTTAVYRDVSSWYHIVVALDTTQATSSNRLKIYINGEQVTSFSTETYPTQNTDYYVNATNIHYIGKYGNDSTRHLNGYLTEIHFVDGQALTPSDFGETDATTGVWKPKAYAGTYGTNGFYLNFSDNTSTTTLGEDQAGSNDWTLNNFSVTAGAGNDSLVDTPTPYGTDTGVGGEVRGNYCTLNPLANSFPSQPASWTTATITQGNLRWVSTATERAGNTGTIAVASGKFYWEVSVVSAPTGSLIIGVAKSNSTYGGAGQIEYQSDSGGIFVEGVLDSTGSTYTSGDLIGVAYNADDDEITFYKNNVSQGVVSLSGFAGTLVAPMVMDRSSSAFTVEFNFGARPFAYTAPSGFKALCTQNLPTPTVVQGDDYFNTVLYTGTGSSQSITGVGFQPDWVWIKERSGAADHGLYDAVRGVQQQLESNTTDAETTESTGLTAFGSDGFTVGSLAQLNTNTDTYVAWNWNAGGSNATNTDGTITSTVRANPTAGFSIVSYTGTGANATVGHGLGVAPEMIIIKARNQVREWVVGHQYLDATAPWDYYLQLAQTAAKTDLGLFQDTAPTSTVFYQNGGNAVGASGETHVAYCFAKIEGYSKFGSYTGNGSTDGPFVYCGFRPAFVMIKRTDTTGQWFIFDAIRSTYNVVNKELYPNANTAEATFDKIDFLSSGFKMRTTGADNNASGGTYIFIAFAENPFKYSLAR